MAGSYGLWPYSPNLGGNIYFIVEFLILFFIELAQVLQTKRKNKSRVQEPTATIAKHKSKRFINQQIPLLIGLALEPIGYGLRVDARSTITSVTVYALQTLCILLAPIFMAATMYMILGQIMVVLHAEKWSLIRVKYLTKIFVASDIVSFLLQAAGGSLMAVENARDFGKWLAVAGLIVQLVFFFSFICLSFHFWYKIYTMRLSSSASPSLLTPSLSFAANYSPSSTSPEKDSNNKREILLANSLPEWGNWKHALVCLQIACIMVFIRSVYRTIEFSEGFNGPIQSLESKFFVLDSTMITVASFALLSVNYSNFFHTLAQYHSSTFGEVLV